MWIHDFFFATFWFHIFFRFSVDFCAHICHSYFHSEENSPAKKVEHSLTTYGLPVTQGAISTMLGVTPFFFIDSYILQTFAKMVILVAAFGLFHGILVIPTFLMIFGGATQSTEGQKIKKESRREKLWNRIYQKTFFREIAFLAVLKFFPVQKLIFGHFWNCKKMEFGQKIFRQIGLFDFTSFFGLVLFNFLAHSAIGDGRKRKQFYNGLRLTSQNNIWFNIRGSSSIDEWPSLDRRKPTELSKKISWVLPTPNT